MSDFVIRREMSLYILCVNYPGWADRQIRQMSQLIWVVTKQSSAQMRKHYSNGTWTSWRLKSPSTRLLVQYVVQPQQQNNNHQSCEFLGDPLLTSWFLSQRARNAGLGFHAMTYIKQLNPKMDTNLNIILTMCNIPFPGWNHGSGVLIAKSHTVGFQILIWTYLSDMHIAVCKKRLYFKDHTCMHIPKYTQWAKMQRIRIW